MSDGREEFPNVRSFAIGFVFGVLATVACATAAVSHVMHAEAERVSK